MAKRSGTADLPLHHGKVPMWLARRMADLAAAITEVIVDQAGPDEFLTRLSDPAWFQAFGAVLGMDWHSSGMTTSVMGALKRALADREKALGIYVCGGRGRHSRKTPEELMRVADATGLDGEELARTSRLVAKVDNAAVADGYNLYLHGFVVTAQGKWVVIQQGMRPETKTARRYHWRSETVSSFLDEPHEGIVGIPGGTILNLTDHRAERARQAMTELAAEPEFVLQEIETLRRLEMPARHEVRLSDVFLRRFQAVLRTASEQQAHNLENILLVPGMGPRSVEALALVSEVVYGTPSRFSDPARFAFAHGGKDGFPHPVLTSVYDHTIDTLRRALAQAKVGRTDKIEAFRRLEQEVRRQESLIQTRQAPREKEDTSRQPGRETADPVEAASKQGWRDAAKLGGRTVRAVLGPDSGKRGRRNEPVPKGAPISTSKSSRGIAKKTVPRSRLDSSRTKGPSQLSLPGLEPTRKGRS